MLMQMRPWQYLRRTQRAPYLTLNPLLTTLPNSGSMNSPGPWSVL